jgi:hypothetical protein
MKKVGVALGPVILLSFPSQPSRRNPDIGWTRKLAYNRGESADGEFVLSGPGSFHHGKNSSLCDVVVVYLL